MSRLQVHESAIRSPLDFHDHADSFAQDHQRHILNGHVLAFLKCSLRARSTVVI